MINRPVRSAGSDKPLVWLLLGDKGGDNAQLRILAAALGWPCAERRLTFNSFYRVPNVLLGASLRSLATCEPALGAPWPDIVLASGRRAVPVARWIQAQSGGRCRLVHVGRTWAPLTWFDLVVAMPQYHGPVSENVVCATLPLNRIAAEHLATEAMRWRPRIGMLPPPYISVLLGGPARPLRFGIAEVRAIGEAANRMARRRGASILAVTSRRSPPGAAAAFAAALDVPHLVHEWSPGTQDNPYAAFLGLAECVIVSGDSASMLAEACRTGHPTIAVPLPYDGSARACLGRSLDAVVPSALARSLQRHGLAVASRDMRSLLHDLARRGHIALITAPDAPTTSPPDDLPQVLARIRALMVRAD